MSEFELIEADEQDYDSVIDRITQASSGVCPEVTIFHRADYLQAAVDNFDIYFIKKGASIRAGLSLVKDHSGGLVLDDLVIHCGPWFCIPEDSKPVRARAERFRILDFLSHKLSVMYGRVALAFHPAIKDIRPFLWYNYHAPTASPRYTVDVRFTSFLHVDKKYVSEEELFARMDTLRQRHIRESKRNDLEISFEIEADFFLELYRSLMASQGEDVSGDKLRRMGRLICALKEVGRLFPVHVRNRATNNSYVVLMVHDGQVAYYLFGAGSLGRQERYLGTRAFWEAFLRSRSAGISYIDLEGVNSPKRGAFKLSFGGDLRTYYEVLLHDDFSQQK